MLETTTACERGPADGPIGFTNGVFIVVGGTSVANHQVATPRMVGDPMPRSDEAATGSVATTAARAWISPPSVRIRTPSPTLRTHPHHVHAVLDRLLQAERELVGQRLHAQRGEGGHARDQVLHAQHRELVGGAQVLVAEGEPEERP